MAWPQNELMFNFTHLFTPCLSSFSKTPEDIRSRLFLKSLDAALTAPLRPRHTGSGYIRLILHPRTSNYERVAALVNLAGAIWPGTAEKVTNFLFRANHLPFATIPVELLGYGSGATVFLLKRPNRYQVLKIYRRSLGKSSTTLLKIARVFREKYEMVCGWYNGRYQLVAPAQFLILQSLLRGATAVAVLQPYVAGEKKDLFQDFSDVELLTLLQNDEELYGQFIFFAEQTLYAYTQQGRCMDLLGRNNILVMEQGQQRRLQIIDYGMFDVAALKRESSAAFPQIEHRMVRLKRLLQELEPS